MVKLSGLKMQNLPVRRLLVQSLAPQLYVPKSSLGKTLNPQNPQTVSVSGMAKLYALLQLGNNVVLLG